MTSATTPRVEGAGRSGGRERSAVLGRTIAGKFLIESYLGGGAMGAVYRARQIALEKSVAIKLLHREHTADPMSTARVVDVVSQALAAIAVAHDMGVVHRDLKPENIMVQ